jgi:arylsulfatase A-like enzyme
MTQNLILVVLDAVRKDHLSVYGADRRTSPTLEALAADPDGVVYDRAISAAPWTLPSHASMFTGQYPSVHGCMGLTPTLEADRPVVADLLSQAGYRTVGYSNSSFTSTTRGYARGFDTYHDVHELPTFKGTYYEPSREFVQLLLNKVTRGHDTASFQTAKLCTAVRDAARDDVPLFGFINLNSAHSPYNPPKKQREWAEDGFDRWDEVDMDVVRQYSEDAFAYMAGHIEPNDAEWDLLKRWYDGEIRYIDDLLATLVATLKQAGVYEETTIVVTADHGEHFGESGLAYHQFSLSEVLVNVPFVVKWGKGLPTDTRAGAGELVSLVDLAPTFLDAAGQTPPAAMQGRSLLSDPEPAVVFAEYGFPYRPLLERKTARHGDHFGRFDRALQAARTRTHKLVLASDGELVLLEVGLDLDERPVEDEQLAADLVEAIQSTLGRMETAAGGGGADDALSTSTISHLEHLGYL